MQIASAAFLLLPLLVLLSFGHNRSEASKSSQDDGYDANGCCTSCGQFYCRSSGRCVTDWNSCDLGRADTNSCSFVYNASSDGTQFSYELGSYKQNVFKITDKVSQPNVTFAYYFGLCDSVAPNLLPNDCGSTSGAADEICQFNASAYQYSSFDNDDHACYRLSSCFESSSPTSEIGLLDPAEPAMGVYIKYKGKQRPSPSEYTAKLF